MLRHCLNYVSAFVTEFTSARGQVYKLHVIDTAGQVSAVSYLNLAQIVYVHT